MPFLVVGSWFSFGAQALATMHKESAINADLKMLFVFFIGFKILKVVFSLMLGFDGNGYMG
jgi:hypothetical protein